MPVLEPTLRVMIPDEAPAVLKLMGKIGWDHSLDQTRECIVWGGKGSFCLAFGDEIVATTIAIKYNQRLAWIGLVISDPDYQRRGFARRLMNHAMSYLSDVDSVMLDASTMGFPVYDRMGFQSLYKINAYIGTPQRFEPNPSIRPMTTADMPTILAMDYDVVGVSRSAVLHWLFETGQGFVATKGNAITGFIFVKKHLDTLRLAGWNAHDVATAEALFQHGSTLAVEENYPKYRINIPDPNTLACDIAIRHKLPLDRYVTRMVYGKEPPGHMDDQYGIIAFMTG